jgi:integrase
MSRVVGWVYGQFGKPKSKASKRPVPLHPLLRISEILALQWKDVHSDGQQIQVTKGEDQRFEVTAGLAQRFRMQRIVFETASEVYDQMAPKWKGSREYLLAHLVRLVEQYINSGRVIVDPPLFNEDDKRRRIVITLNMTVSTRMGQSGQGARRVR